MLCLSCIVPYMVRCARATLSDLVDWQSMGRERWCFAHKWNAVYSVRQLIGHSFTFIISAIWQCVSKNDDSIWSLRTITHVYTHARANKQTNTLTCKQRKHRQEHVSVYANFKYTNICTLTRTHKLALTLTVSLALSANNDWLTTASKID